MMGTHFSQSSLQLLSDSIQISIEFIPIKTFCAFILQMHLSHKCIYINAFAINAFLSLLIYLPRNQTLAIILMSFLLSIIYYHLILSKITIFNQR